MTRAPIGPYAASVRLPRVASVLSAALLAATLAVGCLPAEQPPSTPLATEAATAPALPSPTAVPTLLPLPTATPPTLAPRPTPTAPVASSAPARPGPQAAVLERIKTVVAQIRQLEPRADLPIEVLNQQQLKELVVQLFDRDYLPDERESDQRLLVALGLVGEHQSVVAEWLALYEEQVAGMYDDDVKKMYVVSSSEGFGPEEQVTFAHEYVHALQDQHFNLKAVAPKHSDNQDRVLAAHALFEGDATLTMALYAGRELTREQLAQLGRSGSSSRLSQAPLVMRTELIFPYTEGLNLVRRLYSRGGFAAVNQAFADPPRSTEQVLHPEKYDRREAPLPVSLPDLSVVAGEGWTHLRTNTLGELYLRVLIEQYGDAETARAAASGWGGDRWQVLTRGAETALVLRTVWDTEADAREFLSAYLDGLAARFRGRGQLARSDDGGQLTAPGYWIAIRGEGARVDAVIASDAEAGRRLADWLAGYGSGSTTSAPQGAHSTPTPSAAKMAPRRRLKRSTRRTITKPSPPMSSMASGSHARRFCTTYAWNARAWPCRSRSATAGS